MAIRLMAAKPAPPTSFQSRARAFGSAWRTTRELSIRLVKKYTSSFGTGRRAYKSLTRVAVRSAVDSAMLPAPIRLLNIVASVAIPFFSAPPNSAAAALHFLRCPQLCAARWRILPYFPVTRPDHVFGENVDLSGTCQLLKPSLYLPVLGGHECENHNSAAGLDQSRS